MPLLLPRTQLVLGSEWRVLPPLRRFAAALHWAIHADREQQQQQQQQQQQSSSPPPLTPPPSPSPRLVSLRVEWRAWVTAEALEAAGGRGPAAELELTCAAALDAALWLLACAGAKPLTLACSLASGGSGGGGGGGGDRAMLLVGCAGGLTAVVECSRRCQPRGGGAFAGRSPPLPSFVVAAEVEEASGAVLSLRVGDRRGGEVAVSRDGGRGVPEEVSPAAVDGEIGRVWGGVAVHSDSAAGAAAAAAIAAATAAAARAGGGGGGGGSSGSSGSSDDDGGGGGGGGRGGGGGGASDADCAAEECDALGDTLRAFVAVGGQSAAEAASSEGGGAGAAATAIAADLCDRALRNRRRRAAQLSGGTRHLRAANAAAAAGGSAVQAAATNAQTLRLLSGGLGVASAALLLRSLRAALLAAGSAEDAAARCPGGGLGGGALATPGCPVHIPTTATAGGALLLPPGVAAGALPSSAPAYGVGDAGEGGGVAAAAAAAAAAMMPTSSSPRGRAESVASLQGGGAAQQVAGLGGGIGVPAAAGFSTAYAADGGGDDDDDDASIEPMGLRFVGSSALSARVRAAPLPRPRDFRLLVLPFTRGSGLRWEEDVLLDGSVGAAYVCAPLHSQRAAELVGEGAGRHVLVERPCHLRGDRHGLAEVIGRAVAVEKLFMIGFHRRHDPQFAAARAHIHGGGARGGRPGVGVGSLRKIVIESREPGSVGADGDEEEPQGGAAAQGGAATDASSAAGAGGGGGGPDAQPPQQQQQQVMKLVVTPEQLARFYERHDPSKIEHVHLILSQYVLRA